MDIFKRKKIQEQDNSIKALLNTVNSLQLDISESNQLFKAVFGWLNNSNALSRDKLSNAVKYGYEGNVSCFGIINVLSTIFAKPEDKLFLYDKSGDKKEVQAKDYGLTFLMKPNFYQSWTEFKKTWATSYYTNGNSVIYAEKLDAGNNKGRLLNNQMFVMPAQGVEIFSNGWQKPIDKYGFDIDGGQRKIDAFNIWHERFAPNLDYNNGRNFWGISPVLVALNIILSQNEGYEFISNTYAKRMPPGIIFSDDEYKQGITEQNRKSTDEAWNKHHTGEKADGKPVFMSKGHYEKIGFDSFRDLQVLETQADGSRQLATAFGVPSQIFNDIAGTTYANQSEAFKRLIALRTEPDWNTFYDGINTDIIHAYDTNLYLEPDLSKISELIKNLESIAKVYDIGVRNKSISKNEFREALGLDNIEELGMDDVGDNVLDSFPTLQQVSNNLGNE